MREGPDANESVVDAQSPRERERDKKTEKKKL
jgi:hypothetical protein